MAERRPLIDGLKKPSPPVDPSREKEFVYTAKQPAAGDAPGSTKPVGTSRGNTQAKLPISTRIRADFATALKRASLERQLEGVEPNTLQDILEEAIEPWLRTHHYLK
jgi:hypothetical protein